MFLKVYGSLPPAGSLCQRLPGYCRRKEDARPVHRNDFGPSEMMMLGCPGSSHGSHFASHRKMPCTSLSPPKKTASLTLPMPDPFPTHPAPSSSNHCSCTSTQQAQLLSANFKQKKNASLVLSWDRHLLPTKGRGMAGGRHCWLRPTGLSTEIQGHGTAPVLPKHPLQRCPSDTSSPHLHTFRTTQGVSYTHLPQPTVKSTHFRARIPPAFHLEKKYPVTPSNASAANQAGEVPGRRSLCSPPAPLPTPCAQPSREGGHAAASQRFSAGISGN